MDPFVSVTMDLRPTVLGEPVIQFIQFPEISVALLSGTLNGPIISIGSLPLRSTSLTAP
jgi:hypothetical protein